MADSETNLPIEKQMEVVLRDQGNELTKQILEENDMTKFEDLTQLFTINQKKKNIARQNRLSNLLNAIDDEVETRLTLYPESFDNDQLVKYMDSTQKAIHNTEQAISQAPTIQINNKTEFNINSSGLNRESRAKVLDVVQAILNGSVQGEDIIDVEVE